MKDKVKKAAFKYLQDLKATHSKVKDIEYIRLETQDYLKSELFTNSETKMLFALRSRTCEKFKDNFRHLYGGQVDCPLLCWEQGESPRKDSQQHLLEYKTHTTWK